MKIEGRNAVAEALAAGITIDRLVVRKGLRDAGAERLIADAKSRNIKIFFREKEIMDKECGGKRHQGFIAEVTDYKYCEVEDILDCAAKKQQTPFILILDGIEDPHNLGSILRVAECAGVHGVIIPRHRSVTVNDTVIKVSAGAAAHMRVAKVTNLSDTIEELKKQGIWVYCADMDGGDIYKTDLTGPVAIVVGGEGSGVGKRVKSVCDGVVALPMFGKVNSLNASVSAAVVVYEKIRQESAKANIR
ncbi:MAG: 23S rRNA (guanosine(2251)-2'-O)-methyltransferase RlmB [Clostridia bacterium]|nr:23S rRNA (guanosine(2251)-2'-O)-methyltransferase RlmB [Clostridia bacterium]